jgi:hypothetical protein
MRQGSASRPQSSTISLRRSVKTVLDRAGEGAKNACRRKTLDALSPWRGEFVMGIVAALVIGFIGGFALSEYRRRRRAAGAIMLEQVLREIFDEHRVELGRMQEPQ